MPDGNITGLLFKVERDLKIDKITQNDPYFKANVLDYNEVKPKNNKGI